jgi:hypothetical protein
VKRYTARLYDTDGNLLDVLENITGANYSRRLSEATEIGFSFPGTDNKKANLNLATQFELYRYGKRMASGILSKRDFKNNPLSVSGMTNEIKLSYLKTPGNWVWNNVDLADVYRDLCLEYKCKRFQAPSEYKGTSSNVRSVSGVGNFAYAVVLETDENNHFKPSGYITTGSIDLGEDVYRIDRIRWSETPGSEIKITVQFRTSDDNITWSEWSSEYETLFSEAGIDLVSLALSDPHRYIDIKTNLYTNDTETEGPGDPPTVYGVSPYLHALEIVWRRQTELDSSLIPASLNVMVNGYEANYSEHLAVAKELSDKYECEFLVDGDNNLIVGKPLGNDYSNEVIIRPGRDTNIQTLEVDDSELIQILICLGAGDGVGQLMTVLIDDESIGKYWYKPGKIGTYENKDCNTIEQLRAEGQKYLDEHSEPKYSFVVQTVIDPEWPDLAPGDIIRVIDAKNGIDAKVRITEEKRQDGGVEIVEWGLNTDLADTAFAKLIAQAHIDKARENKRASETLTPPAPVNVRARGQIGQITISWSGVGNKYRIAHSTDGVNFETLDIVSTRSYIHTGLSDDSTHYYQIYAVKNYTESESSGIVSATTSLITKIVTYFQDEPPVAETIGDLWFDTNDGNKLYRWDGEQWAEAQDTGIADAISAAATAQDTADGKITTYYQNEPPTPEAIGDLWFDTDDGNRLYRWNGVQWADSRDNGINQALEAASTAITNAATAQATADGKVTTFFQNEPPTAEGDGDLWIDTNDGNKLYRWNGSQWEDVQDVGISQAITAAATAQETADRKITSYYQNDPPGGASVGDLWTDTNDNNHLYRYDGMQWVSIRDDAPNTSTPISLNGIGLSFGEDSTYQSADGVTLARVTINLSGIPADPKRAYVQIKHRRQGSTEYKLDDQLTTVSGNVTVTVDDLLPGVTYEFAIVPVSYYGVPGEAKTGSKTTAKDTQPPTIPTTAPAVSAGSKIIGVTLTGSSDADLAFYKVQRREAPAEWSEPLKLWQIPASPTWGVWADAPGGITQNKVWIDTNVDCDKCYQYRYQAVDASGNESPYSDISNAIAPSQYGSLDIAYNSVTTGHLAAGAVTADKIEAGAITADKISAGEISYGKLNVVYATVTSASYWWGIGEIISTPQNYEEWNIIKFPNGLYGTSKDRIDLVHNALNTLVGGYIIEMSTDGIDYHFPLIMSPYNESVNYVFNDVMINIGYSELTPTRVVLYCRKTSGPNSDFWLKFKRHSIA